MHITELPTELIGAICEQLPASSIFTVRRSCKRLEQITAKFFRKRYYEEICILVTPRNLEFLQFVANSENLRQSVRAVYIFPGLWESWKDMKLESFDYYSGRKSREMVPPRLAQERFQAYQQILDEHLELVNTDKLRDCLIEVFGRLCNLDSVGLAHRSMSMDENSRPEPLRCIDWLNIKRRTGQDPALPSDENSKGSREYRARTRVLTAMLAAVSANNIFLKSLTSCRGGHGSLGHSTLETNVISNALRDVREIHLCWTWYMNSKKEYKSNAWEQILKATRGSVERLYWGTASEGIVFRGDRPYHRLEDDLHTQALIAGTGPSTTEDSPYHSLLDGTHFQRLAELKLSSLLLSSSTLPAFFLSTRSRLRKLELSQIQIGRTKSAIEGITRWYRVFKCISEHLFLEYVDLTRLGHAGIFWTLLDPTHGVGAPNALTRRDDHAVWEVSESKFALKEWMRSIRFDIRGGDGYSIENPGRYDFGEDLEMDAWVRSCIRA